MTFEKRPTFGSPKCLPKKNLKHISREEQNSEADIPDFQVGFFEILEEGKRRMEKDEHDEDNSTRELDDFIAAERSSDTKGENTKYE